VALWHIADALASDAYLARQQKDLERLLRDIESINRLADQLREHDLVPTAGHIPLVLSEIALDAAIHALAAPQIDAFTLSQLQRLAHLFAAPGTAAQLLTFEHDRTMLRDLVQHVYSDDGSGDGRLTPQGVDYLAAMRSDAFAPREMNAFSWYFNDPRRALDHYRRAVGPLLPLLVASRRELLDTGERLIDLGEARLARPWWQADWDSLRQQLSNWRQSPTMRLKYTPLLSFLPAMESFHAAAERYLGRRDGLLIAIALEAYRREHGLYPESLDALMPALLPTVPTDRINGRPLRYRLVDGETRVYSVGADGDDDGGRAPTYRGQPAAHRAGPRAGSRAPEDGDWLLWPPTP
jgi:hypothetical protein